jgi:O-antigen/teichoic acid export membrane protein
MAVAAARPAARVHRQALIVSVASLAGNVSNYVFTVVAARLLVPASFGELSALMAVLVVGIVPAMSVQTGVALYVATVERTSARRSGIGSAVGLGVGLGAAVGVTALACAPVLVALLHLRGAGPALVLPVALTAFPVYGALCGVLQGRQRFGSLALVMGLDTVLRIGGAIVGLVIGRSATAALVGLATGIMLATAAAFVLCGRPWPARPAPALLRGVAHAAYATVGLVVLLNLDVILARNVLSAHASGVYAVGAVLAKAAYWLPQAVALVVLPRLADSAGRGAALRAGVLAVLAIDTPVVLFAALVGPRLLPVIGGAGYRGEVVPLWLFALTGSLLAVAQLLLFSRVASGDVRSILAVWLAIGAEVCLVVGRFHGSVTAVVGSAATVAGLLVLAGAVVEIRSVRVPPFRSGAAGNGDGGSRDAGTDGHQHGGLGDPAVGPALPVPAEPADDRDGGGDTGPAEHEPRHRPRVHLPHERAGDQ